MSLKKHIVSSHATCVGRPKRAELKLDGQCVNSWMLVKNSKGCLG